MLIEKLEWSPYFAQRCAAKDENGTILIIPEENDDPIPVFCPLCRFFMKTADDAECFRDYSCCHSCTNRFVYPNEQAWKSGWRPSGNELATYVIERTNCPVRVQLI